MLVFPETGVRSFGINTCELEYHGYFINHIKTKTLIIIYNIAAAPTGPHICI